MGFASAATAGAPGRRESYATTSSASSALQVPEDPVWAGRRQPAGQPAAPQPSTGGAQFAGAAQPGYGAAPQPCSASTMPRSGAGLQPQSNAFGAASPAPAFSGMHAAAQPSAAPLSSTPQPGFGGSTGFGSQQPTLGASATTAPTYGAQPAFGGTSTPTAQPSFGAAAPLASSGPSAAPFTPQPLSSQPHGPAAPSSTPPSASQPTPSDGFSMGSLSRYGYTSATPAAPAAPDSSVFGGGRSGSPMAQPEPAQPSLSYGGGGDSALAALLREPGPAFAAGTAGAPATGMTGTALPETDDSGPSATMPAMPAMPPVPTMRAMPAMPSMPSWPGAPAASAPADGSLPPPQFGPSSDSPTMSLGGSGGARGGLGGALTGGSGGSPLASGRAELAEEPLGGAFGSGFGDGGPQGGGRPTAGLAPLSLLPPPVGADGELLAGASGAGPAPFAMPQLPPPPPPPPAAQMLPARREVEEMAARWTRRAASVDLRLREHWAALELRQKGEEGAHTREAAARVRADEELALASHSQAQRVGASPRRMSEQARDDGGFGAAGESPAPAPVVPASSP
eukprot:TRINITY_DN3671_c0_g1_i1.p1 TRINITY_DN3671_c0_g1~~TRINITY_DN3671_c0_g1_i1.p1  ORF type:complete len:586 (+),score=176.51 TRINITY_DN3671_c0_g1_i1:59-1759(+)